MGECFSPEVWDNWRPGFHRTGQAKDLSSVVSWIQPLRVLFLFSLQYDGLHCRVNSLGKANNTTVHLQYCVETSVVQPLLWLWSGLRAYTCSTSSTAFVKALLTNFSYQIWEMLRYLQMFRGVECFSTVRNLVFEEPSLLGFGCLFIPGY